MCVVSVSLPEESNQWANLTVGFICINQGRYLFIIPKVFVPLTEVAKFCFAVFAFSPSLPESTSTVLVIILTSDCYDSTSSYTATRFLQSYAYFFSLSLKMSIKLRGMLKVI